jgi:hypothetical protein
MTAPANPPARPMPTIAERIAARLDLPRDNTKSWRRRADCGEG